MGTRRGTYDAEAQRRYYESFHGRLNRTAYAAAHRAERTEAVRRHRRRRKIQAAVRKLPRGRAVKK